MRHLTATEHGLVAALVAKLDEAMRLRVLQDLESSFVEDDLPDKSRLVFHIRGYERPVYKGQHAFPVDGTLRDSDGAELSVALYADENGRLLELEVIRHDGSDVIRPDLSTLQIY